MLEVREAVEEDVEEVAELMLEQQREDSLYDPFLENPEKLGEFFEKYLRGLIKSSNGFVFVAEINGRICGYISGRIGKWPGYARPLRVGFIHNLFVRKEFRGRGIGKELARYALENLESRVDVFDLEVYAGNNRALTFWRKLGFEVFTLRMVKQVSK